MKEKRTRKVTVRFTPKEYQSLEKKFQNAIASELSDNIRKALLEKPIIIKYRNASLDSFMEEIIQLKQELHAVGNNFNQAVKKLHVLRQISEFREWITINEALHQQFFDKTMQIDKRIEEISEQWLQG